MKEKVIRTLTRVEGLGRMRIKMEGEEIKGVRLEIFEPPRFFESIVKGKKPDQVLDMVARICGLCPVAYQMSGVEAFEKIFGIDVPAHIKDLRRVLYCGEWISSHSAHIFFLHLPDFFGKQSSIELAKERKDLIEKGLKIRKAGNRIIEVLGGRHVHPVNVRVGGFYRMPREKEVEEVIGLIDEALPVAEECLEEFMDLEFPDTEREYEFISLGDAERYPFMEGKVVSSEGWNIEKEKFEEVFEEFQLPHSTALYSRIRDKGFYLVGAIARFNNNFEKLDDDIKEKVKGFYPIKNTFKSIIARSTEIIYSLREAKRLFEKIDLKESPYVEYEIREGEGVGITEAPRGILYHRYRVNKEGLVEYANIIPPTSQNQGIMEEEVLEGLKKIKGNIETVAEKIIRNFDPCISCASHFLEVIREG